MVLARLDKFPAPWFGGKQHAAPAVWAALGDPVIVLAGFEGEHGTTLTDAGWGEVEWFEAGHLRGGMGNLGPDGHQQNRERLWLSSHCLREDKMPLFGE